jgi:hypothetical protein
MSLSAVFSLRRRLSGERGTALVLALVMLALMSILGALALSTSSTEVGISGNYRFAQQALLAADRAVEYAVTNEDIFNRIGTGSIDLDDDAGAADNLVHVNNIAAGTGDSGLSGSDNEVEYIGVGGIPPGYGSDPALFQGRYYVVRVTARGPNNSSSRVEQQVVRVVPK